MTPQVALTLIDPVKHSELAAQQRLVLAWLRPVKSNDAAYPGVVLNPDAVLIKAPRVLLTRSIAGLEVIVETADGLGHPVPVAEVKLIGLGSGADPSLVTAMLRLAVPIEVDIRTRIDRGRYWAELRQSDEFWHAVTSIGLVPSDLAELLPPAGLPEIPHAAPVFPLIKEARMGWCDIFWWLC